MKEKVLDIIDGATYIGIVSILCGWFLGVLLVMGLKLIAYGFTIAGGALLCIAAVVLIAYVVFMYESIRCFKIICKES